MLGLPIETIISNADREVPAEVELNELSWGWRYRPKQLVRQANQVEAVF